MRSHSEVRGWVGTSTFLGGNTIQLIIGGILYYFLLFSMCGQFRNERRKTILMARNSSRASPPVSLGHCSPPPFHPVAPAQLRPPLQVPPRSPSPAQTLLLNPNLALCAAACLSPRPLPRAPTAPTRSSPLSHLLVQLPVWVQPPSHWAPSLLPFPHSCQTPNFRSLPTVRPVQSMPALSSPCPPSP